jgi:aryl-phospho-beta-D-glucosidase BglC (GH1 family)
MNNKSTLLPWVKSGLHFLIISYTLFYSVTVKAELPTAEQLASKMKNGWNLGNTLEVTWATPGTTTQAAIDSVKSAGFNTVRLPVAWFHHADTNSSTIDVNWFGSVKKVVDFCIKDSLYVIINAHWDHGWLENRIDAANKDIVNQRQKAYWMQIANYFKNYDEHLLFAGANEPNVTDSIGMSILLSYHQTFINAVRATGGNNSSRTLIIQGPSADIEKTNRYMNVMPADQIENRLIVEIHYYTPWNFCGLEQDASWGKVFYYWGKGNHSSTDAGRNATWGEESTMDSLLGLMKTKFIDKGIPVIIGEYGAFRKHLNPPSDQTLHNASIEYYYKYFTQSAISKGLIPYCWDTGGIFNFITGKVVDRIVLNAIIQGAKEAATSIITNKGTAKEKYIEVYQNPLTSTFNIKVDNPEEIVSISIFDIMGKLVKTFGRSEVTNSMHPCPPQNSKLFIVRVNGASWTKTFKLLEK